MPVFSFYDETGQIKAQVLCDKNDLKNNMHGDAYIEGDALLDAHTVYVATGGVVANKLVMTPVVSGMTISGLPTPCTAIIEGAAYQVTDGTLDLSANLPGPYTVLLKAGPYLDAKVTVQ